MSRVSNCRQYNFGSTGPLRALFPLVVSLPAFLVLAAAQPARVFDRFDRSRTVVSDSERSRMISVEKATGAIYVSDGTSGAEWRLLGSPGLAPNPAAIAVSGDFLYLLYPANKEILKVSLSNPKDKSQVEQNPALVGADALAVTPKGSWAALSSGKRLVFWKPPDVPLQTIDLTSIPHAFRPKLGLDEDFLYLAETTFGSPFTVPLKIEPKLNRSIAAATALLPKIFQSLGRIEDFALYRGVIYVAGAKGVFASGVSTATQGTPAFAVANGRCNGVSVSSHNAIYFCEDSSGIKAAPAPRPVPSIVTIEPGSEGVATAIYDLATYVASLGGAATNPIPPEAYVDLASLIKLVPELLLQPPEPAEPPDPALSDTDRFILFTAVCLASLLSTDPEQDRDACRKDPTGTLTKLASARRPVVLPALSIKRVLTWTETDLDGTSARARMEQNGVDPSLRAKYETDVVAQREFLDRNLISGTLLAEIYRRGLFPVTGATAPPLGSVVMNDDPYTPVGSLASCFDSRSIFEHSPEPVLPMLLRAGVSDGPIAQLLAPELRQSVGGEVKLITTHTRITSLKQPALLRNELPIGKDNCVTQLLSGGRAVISEVLVSAEGLIRGDLLPGGAARAISGNAQLTIDADGTFALKYDKTATLAYRLSRANDFLQAGPQTSWSEASALDKGAAVQAILDKTSGPVRLPAVHWRITLALPRADFDNPDSLLSSLRKKFQGKIAGKSRAATLSIYPAERIDFRPAAFFIDTPSISGSAPPPDPTELHAATLRAIDFPGALIAQYLREHQAIIVGVAESPATVNERHPHFQAPEKATKTNWKTVASPSGADCPGIGPVICDHGTFVGGIIAGKGVDFPGLLPNAELRLIESGTVENTPNSLGKAIREEDSLRVINLSLTIPSDDRHLIEDLEGAIRERWNKCLFVTASGNDGANLGTREGRNKAEPIVSYLFNLDNQRNVLAVAASNEKGELAKIKDAKGGEVLLSNVGRPYVQLVAPGVNIVSARGSSSYGIGAGSSFAAPQVSAAAAVLFDELSGAQPSIIKARLIYTTDPIFQDKLGSPTPDVWGGRLNVRRAVSSVAENVVTLQGDKSKAISVKFLDETVSIQVTNANVDCRPDFLTHDPTHDFDCPSEIPIKKLLRLIHLPGDEARFRVIYIFAQTRDVGQLRILDGARISGKLAMAQNTTTDIRSGTTTKMNSLRLDLDAADLGDYTAGIQWLPKELVLW